MYLLSYDVRRRPRSIEDDVIGDRRQTMSRPRGVGFGAQTGSGLQIALQWSGMSNLDLDIPAMKLSSHVVRNYTYKKDI